MICLSYYCYLSKNRYDYFHSTVLKIEGDDVSAVDVAHQLDVLRGNLLLRKAEKYLDPNTEAELIELTSTTGEFEREIIEEYFSEFFDNAIDYIDSWTEHFELFRIFSWVVLEHFPNWPTVKKSMDKVGELGSFDVVVKSTAVFEQFSYIKNYCSVAKLVEWRSSELPTDKRRAEIFSHMENNHVAFAEFTQIIEFVQCLAGTSSPVERVFAKGKKIWKQESSNLQVSSLGALLQVKCNMDWACIDFFKFLKTRPDLLRKISSEDKYDFKKPKQVHDSPMSVQFDDSESQ